MDIDDVFCNLRVVGVPTKSAIYMWGYNQSGQTARKGKERHLRIPKSLPPKLFNCRDGENFRWIDIACGREHTAAVASDGSLFTWGANEFGQLGDGTEESAKEPKKVNALETEFVKSVSCGAHCTAAIAEPRENDATISKSRLWVWGQNQGSDYPRLFWGAFAPNTVIRQVSCGAVHVVALSDDGLLQAWGYNEHGQLGRGCTSEGLQGARVLNAYARFLDEAPELVKIVRVSCGEYHAAAISENGEVYTWGLGSMGQLGHCSLQSGDKELIPRRVVALEGIVTTDVSCGGVHSCAVTEGGALYAWGGGHVGQLGLGPQSGFFSCTLNGSDVLLRNIPVLVIPSGVRLVTCGHSHTLISVKDGRIYGWGYNSYGQAANEKSTYAWYPSPVDWCVGEVRRLAAGGGHSAVLTDASSLKELCEFKLAEIVNLSNARLIEDIASRTGADALARLCEKLREHLVEQGDSELLEVHVVEEIEAKAG
ncbi:ultraviolet-B receptor UVR8 [Lolium perenne]|uniref:ultraviolet-B receptor UVR8 n=1 Tax=Lolium perenne TaxID=4522 RepID=UPI0021F589D3|nr:ultraviolet-B receptor UVR8 isoform X2 [Lolium perenne]XP_051180905.1 ultraviolet-B receptor UVR8 isoform X2 [Lolium perenne]